VGTKKGPSTEGGGGSSCCRIESLIRVDERGQIVLPKEIRDKANIYPGDKLALICLKKRGGNLLLLFSKNWKINWDNKRSARGSAEISKN